MKVVWRRAALADIDDMRSWIGRDNPRAAVAVEKRIRASVRNLTATPLLWPMISDGVSRRMIVRRTPYFVYYRVVGDDVIIDAVLHAKRARPV
ncbi:MAG: type II toxin-antitoxin system RelE/ParE family toxin [Hyphomonadaceae bacterium]|nr:type II toxin-antitoxin system RelE/ParE family toxin [Hyphomonadaceae bacterium]